MICVIPFCSKDAALAHDLLLWCVQLGGTKSHPCLLVCDAATSWNDAWKAVDLAEKAFASVKVITNGTPVEGWIPGSNSLFKAAAEWCSGQPFIWLEPDACPLRPTWLDEIESAYAKCGKPFMGTIVNHLNANFPNPYLEGNGIYPPDCWERFKDIWQPEKSWTYAMVSVTIPNAIHTDLIEHVWGQNGNPPTFSDMNIPGTSVFSLAKIKPKSAVWHRNKDGSLIRLLRKRMGIHVPETNGHADFVSLRRNGDIINMLPLCLELSKRSNRKIRLVVHRDFMPLLDGVSYVDGVPWDGEWENPLGAATKFHAKNAQVFGRGLRPNVRTGESFAKISWKQVGYRWNRYLPLVFDRRDPSREEALAASVFKTDKPKILVKVHGFSSPFGEGPFVWQAVNRDFGSVAEVVNLDEVKAERLYDLIGLMDRSNCLLTADTSTLWLAQASKCPMIQMVNSTGFPASPFRGNCLMRLPYSQVPPKWPVIAKLVSTTLNHCEVKDMVLAYYEWGRTPDAAARFKEAYATWPSLGCRILPLRLARNSRSIGDHRDTAFIRDMISAGFNNGTESVLVITNDDIRFEPGLREVVLESCKQWGCYWSYRLLDPSGNTDEGADLFAMTRCWWGQHHHLFPDFLLGYYWWDDIMVRIMRWSGCQEQTRLYRHPPHGNNSGLRQATPGGRHNEKLAQAWLRQYDEEHIKPLSKTRDPIAL